MSNFRPFRRILGTSPWLIIAVIVIAGIVMGATILRSNTIHQNVHVNDAPKLTLSELAVLDGSIFPGGDCPDLITSSVQTNTTYDFSTILVANQDLSDIYLHINITRSGPTPVNPDDLIMTYCDNHYSNDNSTWTWKPIIFSPVGSQLVGYCPPSWGSSISGNDTEHGLNAFRVKYVVSGDYSIEISAAQGAIDLPSGYTITDDRGKEIIFSQAPQRVLSLGSPFTEIIFDLNAQSKVVGVDSSSWWLVEDQNMTASIANMGGVSALSVESILAKEPDLVVIWNFNMYQTVITDMEAEDVTVAAFYPKNVTTILHTIEVLGKAIGEETAADAAVTNIQTRIDSIAEKVTLLTDDQKPAVYLELASQGGRTVGNGTLSNDLINMAGGVNIFANGTGYWRASAESIVEKNPDIIIIENQSSKTNQQLKETLGMGVTAVAEDRIYRIDGTTLATSPSFIEALEQMAKWFHPELYSLTGSPTLDSLLIKGKVIMVTEATFLPFEGYDAAHGTFYGFDIDLAERIVENISKELGVQIDLEIHDISFSSIPSSLVTNQADMALSGIIMTDERNLTLLFSIPYYTAEAGYGMLVKSSDNNLNSVDDLKDATSIVVNVGSTSELWVQKNLIDTGLYPAEKVKHLPTLAGCVQDVQIGQSEVFIIDKPTAEFYADASSGDLKVSGIIPVYERYGVAMNKGASDLKVIVDRVIAEMLAIGEMAELRVKWGLS